MKMRLLGIAMGLFAGVGCAAAADLGYPIKAGPGGPSWSGCHIGLRGGIGAGHNTWTDSPIAGAFIDANGLGETANTDMAGGTIGGQFGCDMQFSGPFVAGVQGNLSAADITGTNFDQFNDTWSLRSNVDWMAAVTGRFGIAVSNVLVYGRGGGAWAHNRFEIENAAANLGNTQMTRLGWTAGAGVEWAFAPNWSAFLEVNYYNFGGQAVAFPGSTNNTLGGATPPFSVNTALTLETFEMGVNYRF
jgi:outer membrane immunogenic protein